MIVKYVEALHNGIQSQALSRYAIGYILRGTKYIYDGDKRQTLTRRRILPRHRASLYRELPGKRTTLRASALLLYAG